MVFFLEITNIIETLGSRIFFLEIFKIHSLWLTVLYCMSKKPTVLRLEDFTRPFTCRVNAETYLGPGKCWN